MINAFIGILRPQCIKFANITLKDAPNLKTTVRNSLNLKYFSAGNVSCQHHYDGSDRSRRQLPNLLYVQNPITWFINKIDFIMLRKAWDTDFVEEEFKRGVRQAVSTICTLISKDLWNDLRGLVANKTLLRMQREMQFIWTKEQRMLIALKPSDIKLTLPRKVHFLRIAEKKFVDIDVICVAMKFKEEASDSPDIVLIEIFARFHRNYTAGQIPDWIVTLFKVTSQSMKQR